MSLLAPAYFRIQLCSFRKNEFSHLLSKPTVLTRSPFRALEQMSALTAQNKNNIFWANCVLSFTERGTRCSYRDVLLFSHQCIHGRSKEKAVIFKEDATNVTKEQPSSTSSRSRITPKEKNMEFIKDISYQIWNHRNCQHQLCDRRVPGILITAFPNLKPETLM